MAEDTKFVKGADKLAARLRKLSVSIRKTVTDGRIPALLLRRTKKRFDKQLDPNERKWEPLSPNTLVRRRSGGNLRRKALHETLRLKQSIAIVKKSSLFSVTGASARIGVNDPVAAAYGRFHQTGEGDLVQRRFLGIGKSDIKAVDLLLEKAIIRGNRLRKTR